jgi:predicted fused transcriptional regulator/phosphomethylpyrimidine kinase/predicted transcriptional regulator
VQPPDELMVQDFLPAIRQLVALRLRAEGLSQNRISSLLGITQASVSLYLSAEPKKAYSSLSGLSISQAEADRYSSMLAVATRNSPVDGVRTLTTIWMDLLGSGSVCPAHKEMYSSLADCEVCIEEYGRRRGARSQAISEVSEAVKMLEASRKFVSVMPEVSVNVACAAGNASTPADVIAVPGRIVRVRDRAKAMLPPEAGASAHMSKVLLLVRTRRPELRACVNVLYDRKMAAVIRNAGLHALSIGNYSHHGAPDPTAEALQEKLKSATGSFDAIIDEGGNGIEPNLYLFAKGAREVAEIALRLARAYSAA